MNEKTQKDTEKIPSPGRVAATSIIWGVSGGMLAICIPLTIITKTGAILPLATIIGATVATFAVWFGKSHNSQIKQLQEKITSLETIVTSLNSDKD